MCTELDVRLKDFTKHPGIARKRGGPRVGLVAKRRGCPIVAFMLVLDVLFSLFDPTGLALNPM